jgi:cytochrome c oxidase assembly factor CtaG
MIILGARFLDLIVVWVLIFIWFLCGITAVTVAIHREASPRLWFVIGFLLGPIGLILALTSGVTCPHCGKRIGTNAVACPHCQQTSEK